MKKITVLALSLLLLLPLLLIGFFRDKIFPVQPMTQID